MRKKIIKVLVRVVIVIAIVIGLLFAGGYWFFKSYTSPSEGAQIPTYENPKTALLVVDIQEDYTGPNAVMPYKDGPRIINAANKLIGRDYQVVYIENIITHPIAKFVTDGLNAPGDPGVKMDRRLLRVPGAVTLNKNRPDAFANPELDEYLRSRSVDHVIIVGLDGAGCVLATIQAALNRGYKVTAPMQGIATESEKSLEEISLEYKKLGVTVVEML